METEQKLNILADSSKFDLACSCRLKDEPGRVRGEAGKWIYPASLPDGRKTFLMKVLQSNECINDCKYCPFNDNRDLQRCSLSPEELANKFIELYSVKMVEGLFLSSGISCSADQTMTKMIDTISLLRYKHHFKGFIHLKIVPGCSDEAIRQAVNLATRVSVNIEAPNEKRLGKLSSKKNFKDGIIHSMKMINHYRQNLNRHCCQTTQFVVGAAGETDKEILSATWRLYTGYEMERIYYSAYQPLMESAKPASGTQMALFADIPLANPKKANSSFIREHRLYQTDYLFRKYGFSENDILLDPEGNLDLELDPKQIWANSHPEFFPIDINRADYYELLRVPGIGPILAKRIVKWRKKGIIQYYHAKKIGINLNKSGNYIFWKKK